MELCAAAQIQREELKSMNLLKRLLSLMLCIMMVLPCVGVQAAESAPYTVVMEEVELPSIETSAQQLGFLGLDADGNPQLKDGNYEKWIDRVDYTDAPYCLTFYQWLEENCAIHFDGDLLIDPTGAQQLSSGQYVYLVTQIKGTAQMNYTGNSSVDGENAWNAALPYVTENEKEAFAHISATYSAFDRDHPEVFWLSGQSRMLDSISYGYNSRGVVNFTQNLYFVLKSGDYDIRSEAFRDPDAIGNKIHELYSDAGIVYDIVSGVDGSANRYEKVKYFNSWLTANNHYNADTPSSNAFESISALTGAYGADAPVCEGYSRAFQVLCQTAGIPCVLVDGMADSGGTREGHMWNYVQMEDGNWYAVDVTWNDPFTGSDTHVSGYENEKYLLVGADTVIGSKAFLDSHPVENTVTVGGLGFVNGPVLSDDAYDPSTAPKPVVIPEVKRVGFTLSFEEIILVNFYYTVSDSADVVEHGMLVFNEAPARVDIAAANQVHRGIDTSVPNRYMGTTDGIVAKDMGDDRYYCAYALMADGTYVYSELAQYSPKQYAINMLGKDTATPQMKALCVAMLNYGAAAQNYFSYRTDELMNASLTDAQKAMVISYDESLFTGAVTADPGKTASFEKTGGFSRKSASVSFEGSFSINFYFTPDAAVAGDVKLYIWDMQDYSTVSGMTADNATETITMQLQSDGSYWGQVSSIAAKKIDDTYFVAGVYTDENGNVSCTGVISYSLSKYCMSNAYGRMGELSQATAMYGYYAEQLFR